MTQIANIVINERETEPLSDYVTDFLFSLNKECAYLDYKWFLDLSKDSQDFVKTMKHIFAFSNYGGGWLLLGWKQNEQKIAEPTGVPTEFNADQSIIQEKINSFTNDPIEVHYKEFFRTINGINKRFGLLYIPPSRVKLLPTKDGVLKYLDGKTKTIFKKDELLFRRGSQSINPSPYEIQLLESRLKTEKYRLMVLRGEPDDIIETLSSNLFPITKLPEFVYLAQKKNLDNVSIKVLLKQNGVFPEWIFKFREYENNIVIFENLEHKDNIYRKIVDEKSIKKEKVLDWLKNPDKKRIIVSLLNKELICYCINKGLYHFQEKNKFFLPCIDQVERNETWISKSGRKATRQVAKKTYASQLHESIFYHHCFDGRFVEIDQNTFCFEIVPSFLLTRDGRLPLSSFTAGTFITRLAYSQFNDKYLNNILFWIYKLSPIGNIKIGDYLEISTQPVSIEINKGMIEDLPSSTFNEEDDEDNS